MCLLSFGQVSSLVHWCVCMCIRVQVCMCLYVQANEGGAPGVMPLFCHYSKWKLCLSMEKGLAQRCMQSFQARPECIPGISAIIHCQGKKKRREQHKKVKTEASTEGDNCLEYQNLKNIRTHNLVLQQLLLKGLERGI